MDNKKVDVGEVIDSARFIGKPLGIAVMMVIIMLTDGFDLFVPSYVAPALVDDWGISKSDIQPFIQAGLIGMAFGSVLLGWIGDRIGRKYAYISCLTLMFIGSAFCFYADNTTDLFVWRLVMGFGLGGITPLATTLVSEWTKRNVRAVVVASVIVAIPMGGMLTGFVDRALVPEYGWRSMFAVGAIVPLVLFLLFSWLLPESPKYMAQRPHLHKRLAKSLNKLFRDNRFDGTEEFFVVEEGKRSSNWFFTIWNSDFRFRTALIWIAFAVNSFVLYLFTSQIPLLLVQAGMTRDIASIGLQFFSGGAVLGSVGGAYLVGWYGSKYTGTSLAALGGVGFAIMALLLMNNSTSAWPLYVLFVVAGASVNGMQAFMYAVSAHSYPTEVRGSAVGMAQTFSRIGAVLSPTVAAVYFGMEPVPPVSAFLFFMVGVICLTTISFYLIPSHIPGNSQETLEEEESQAQRDGLGVAPPE